MLRGGGGHQKILALARGLARHGYAVSVNLLGGNADYPDPGAVVRECGLDGDAVNVVYSSRPVFDSEITFATHWSTVYAIQEAAEAGLRPGRLYHFLQDYEAFFHPVGTDYLLAMQALGRGFRLLSYGPWIARLIAKRHGLTVRVLPFFIDRHVYHPGEGTGPRAADELLFLARPDMPRRCFDLGLRVLERFQQRYGAAAARVITFGSPQVQRMRLRVEVDDRGVLTPAELARLYRTATAGLVFSPTNPSMVPFEMMACGLPVLDLDVEENDVNYGGRENVALMPLDEDAMVETIHRVLRDRPWREQLARNALRVADGLLDEAAAVERLVEVLESDRPAARPALPPG
jgi:glycosyltransferase involved in cell wall biosynthesis